MVKKVQRLLPPGVTGPLTERYYTTKELASTDAAAACREFLALILEPTKVAEINDDDEDVNMVGAVEETEKEDPAKVREAAIYELGKCLIKSGRGEEAKRTFETIRPFFQTIPKSRTAKIIRNFIDLLDTLDNAKEIQEQLCLDTIAWSLAEKRTFLRHRVEVRLALLYHELGRYTNGLQLVAELLKEVKKLDDKLLLVEIHYIEAKLFFTIKNLPKAKAAVTAARSNSNAIHCPPLLQADIDVLSGALHLEDGDAKTGYSYFFEAFEAFHLATDPRAAAALKYQMLSKIMSDQAQEVAQMTTQRQYLSYAGRDIDCFKVVAKSYLNRDLAMFDQALDEYKDELQKDLIVSRHTNKLYQKLLEQNILKVLKPFSRVEVDHIAKLMNLPLKRIQEKLNEMILDQQLLGTLNQSAGVLVLYHEESCPSMYSDSIDVFHNLSVVVDLLYAKAEATL